MIEYAFKLHDAHMHGFFLQVLDDLSLDASFIGISPSSKEFIIPKLKVSLHSLSGLGVYRTKVVCVFEYTQVCTYCISSLSCNSIQLLPLP